MKKRLLALSMASVLALSLTGCGNGSSSPETLSQNAAEENGKTEGAEGGVIEENSATEAAQGEKITLSLCWWGNQTRNDVTKKAADLYMSLNPNVEIKVEFTDWPGYWDKLSTMAAGGNLPDIIQQDYSYISQYQKSGQLADLTEFIDSGIIKTDKIPESIIESGSIDGKCYAISLGSNAPTMIYDKGIVERAGVTIPEEMTVDELYDICQQIYDKTGVASFYDSGLAMMQIVSRERGGHLFDQLTTGDISAIKKHFELVERFSKADFFISPDMLAEKGANVVETRPIIDETTWNDFSFSNLFNTFSTAAGREMGMAMYPATGGSGTEAMFLKPGMFFSIAETSQHKEEAAKFIDWFTNSVECNEVLMAERGVPINTEVAQALKPKLDPMSQEVFDYIAKVGEKATPIDPPDPAGKGEIDTLRQKLTDDIHYGDITADEAAETFLTEAGKIMQEAAK
jgi:multiple sugar transport system substrate-binding protein